MHDEEYFGYGTFYRLLMYECSYNLFIGECALVCSLKSGFQPLKYFKTQSYCGWTHCCVGSIIRNDLLNYKNYIILQMSFFCMDAGSFLLGMR